MESLKIIAITILTPVVRSVVGWAQVAYEDKKITRFEIRKLIQTIFRVGLITSCEYAIAVGYMKIDMGTIELVATSAAAIMTDKILKAWKENKNVTKR